MMTAYSFAMSVIVFNLALIIVYMLRRYRLFMVKHGTQILLLISVLAIARLFSPIDHAHAIIVRSYTIIPAILDFVDVAPLAIMPKLSTGRILFVIWSIGSFFFVLKGSHALYREARKRCMYRAQSNPDIENIIFRLGIKTPVTISEDVPTPHVAGFLRPRIFVPHLTLSEDEWKYVFMHEMQHIKSRDTVMKLFYFIIEALFWWNPVSHLFMRELDALLEMRCDAKVVSGLNEIEKTEYLGALLNVVHQVSEPSKKAVTVNSYLTRPQLGFRQRFDMILNYDCQKNRFSRNLVCFAVVILFILSYFVIIQPAYEPPPEELEDTYTVCEGTSFVLYDGEEYWLFSDNDLIGKIDEQALDNEQYSILPIYEGEMPK